MSRGFFVTGTDTGVGKTCVSLALMRALQSRGLSVAGMKPVASGCQVTASGLLNEDAQQLRDCSSMELAYPEVNPCRFEPAIAPHLAAEASGERIELPVIEVAYSRLTSRADAVVVEGVGGWLVPVDDRHTMADLAVSLSLPVILVVAVRLGCLNHALLTSHAIQQSGLRLAGWVANRIDPDCEFQDGNVRALRERIAAPLLADFEYAANGVWPEQLARKIDLNPLLTQDSS
jgi:dethiobiotin synthetase